MLPLVIQLQHTKPIIIQKLLSELISFKNQECIEEIQNLWWLIYNETSDLETLKKTFQGHEELLSMFIDDERLYKKVENCFTILSTCSSSRAVQWKKLF